jgi:NAD(P)-dependent dehydrogenase (short-subunit alcohol dehydrogenase family)
MQTPEDIAYGTVFLLSDDASQVTGTELHINGGIGL